MSNKQSNNYINAILMLLIGFYFSLSFQQTSAQSPENQLPDDIRFDQITVEDGLISGQTRSILQDKNGFMWFATEQGVNRFDSQNFTLYNINSKDLKRNLGRNRILAMEKSELTSDIWLGADYLIRYDTVLDEIEIFEITQNNGIFSLIEDKDGFIWLGGHHTGLIKFDPKTKTVTDIYPILDEEGNGKKTIYKIEIDSEGIVWAASSAGIHKLNPETEKMSLIQGTPEIASRRISDLALGNQGDFWIGTWEGLFHYANGSLNQIDEEKIGFSQIHSLTMDSRDWLWIGSDKQGVTAHNLNNDVYKQYASEDGEPSRLAPGSVFDIYEDQSGSLWFAVHGAGLYRYSPNKVRFDLTLAEKTKENWLTGSQILALQDDLNGNIFIASDGGGLFMLNEATQTFTHFENDPDDPTSLPSDSVIGLARDLNGNIWVSGWGGGISKFNPDSNTFTRLNTDNSDLVTNNVFTLYVDKNNKLWASMWDHGVQVINTETGLVEKTILGGTKSGDGMTNISVMAILEGADGTMWFGGFSGVDHYDLETGQSYYYSQNSITPYNLSGDTTFTLHKTSDGYIWAGTDSGLNQIDPVTKMVTYFTSANGLPSNSVVGILEDSDGDLWLSTLNGISLFRREQGSFQNFGLSYAIQGKEFNRFSNLSADNGNLYFGGAKGFNSFDPIAIKQKATFSANYDVQFTELFVNHEPIHPGEDSVLSQAIFATENIKLDPNDDVFSIQFAAPIYSHADQIKYEYQLKGFDENWTQATNTNRTITYTNLNPGQYTFNVRALTTFDGSLVAENSIGLEITPKWFQTAWYRLAIFLISLGLIFFIYSTQMKSAVRKFNAEQKAREAENQRIRRHSVEELNGKLLEINKEKNDLIGIVAHDLRNPLGASIMTLNFLTKHGESLSTTKRQELYERLEKSTEKAYQIAEKLVGAHDETGLILKTEPVSVERVIEDTQQEFQLILANKNINLRQIWNIPKTTQVVADKVSMCQILENLVSNSIKYSEKGTLIVIQVSQTKDDKVLIEVEDEGLGMSQEDIDNAFGKYAKLSAKPTGGENSVGLGLYNVKKLVELMEGNVYVSSDGIGQGSTFSFTIPIFEEIVVESFV